MAHSLNDPVLVPPGKMRIGDVVGICGSAEFAKVGSMVSGGGACQVCGCKRKRPMESDVIVLAGAQMEGADTDDDEDEDTNESDGAPPPPPCALSQWLHKAHGVAPRSARDGPRDTSVYDRAYTPQEGCMNRQCRCHTPAVLRNVIDRWAADILGTLVASKIVVFSVDHPAAVPAPKGLEHCRRAALRAAVKPREWTGDPDARLDMNWEAFTADRSSRKLLMVHLLAGLAERLARDIPEGRAVFIDSGSGLQLITRTPEAMDTSPASGWRRTEGRVLHYPPLNVPETDYSMYAIMHCHAFRAACNALLEWGGEQKPAVILRQNDSDTTFAALIPGALDPAFQWYQDLGTRSVFAADSGAPDAGGAAPEEGELDMGVAARGVLNLNAFADGIRDNFKDMAPVDIVAMLLWLGASDYTGCLPLMTPTKVSAALYNYGARFMPLVTVREPTGGDAYSPGGGTPEISAEHVERMVGVMLSLAGMRKPNKQSPPEPVIPLPPASLSDEWVMRNALAPARTQDLRLTKTLNRAVAHVMQRFDLQQATASWTLRYMWAAVRNCPPPGDWDRSGWTAKAGGGVMYDPRMLRVEE